MAKHRKPPSKQACAKNVDKRDGKNPPLFGIHAVEAALNNPERDIQRLFATPNAARRLHAAIAKSGTPVETVSPRDLDRLIGAQSVHQGVILETAPLPIPDLETITATRSSTSTLLVVLDQVTDPHNVGAVIRSAAAFGATGLIMTQRHSPPLAGALAKAASGALEHVRISLQPNLARALQELGELGIVRIGLESSAPSPIEGLDLSGPTALVLGAEDKGLRRLTRENCDLLCHITTPGPTPSLNVSNAAAVALHLAAIPHHPGR